MKRCIKFGVEVRVLVQRLKITIISTRLGFQKALPIYDNC